MCVCVRVRGRGRGRQKQREKHKNKTPLSMLLTTTTTTDETRGGGMVERGVVKEMNKYVAVTVVVSQSVRLSSALPFSKWLSPGTVCRQQGT